MEVNKVEVENDIYLTRVKINEYTDYIDELNSAKRCCGKIRNGLTMLEGSQTNKVKDNCVNGLGEQEDLLSALEFNKTIDNINSEIDGELDNGILAMQDKIYALQAKLRDLYELME